MAEALAAVAADEMRFAEQARHNAGLFADELKLRTPVPPADRVD
jgi:hypothetical protein